MAFIIPCPYRWRLWGGLSPLSSPFFALDAALPAPVVHWIWGGGFLADGGLFGEMASEILQAASLSMKPRAPALIIAFFLEPRKKLKHTARNLDASRSVQRCSGSVGLVLMAARNWPDGGAALAITVTHISAATASLRLGPVEKVNTVAPRLSVL